MRPDEKESSMRVLRRYQFTPLDDEPYAADVPNGAACTCGHFGSAHANMSAGKNTGACSMANCACKAFKAKGGAHRITVTGFVGLTDAEAEEVYASASFDETGDVVTFNEVEFGAATDWAVPYWAFITKAERDDAAKKGEARPDGSYPIRNVGELDKAIHAVGRGGADHDTIRKHIIKRAKALNASSHIPDNWNADGSLKPDKKAAGLEGTEALVADSLPLLSSQEVSAAGLPERWHAYGFVEGLRTTDGRAAQVGAGDFRSLPLPLSWQKKNEPGHRSSEVVGSIEKIDYKPGTSDSWQLVYAEGSFDLGSAEGQECARQVALQGGTRFVSADIEPIESEIVSVDPTAPPSDDILALLFGDSDCYELLTNYRILGMTVVATPAFPQCVIAPIDVDLEIVEPQGLPDLPPAPTPMLLASAIHPPVEPPSEWFDPPQLKARTPLYVTEAGEVFGHIAERGRQHTGYLRERVTPPMSNTGYAYFMTGEIRCADGTRRHCGTITMGAGHADKSADWLSAKAHYDGGPGAIQMCDVAVGEDEFGIWAHGALRPGVTEEQVREFTALSPSGDWRKISGSMELIAVAQVIAPGFPVLSLAASASPGTLAGLVAYATPIAVMHEGEMFSLVAAGRVFDDPGADAWHALDKRLRDIEANWRLLRPLLLAQLDAQVDVA
jgi:hypothetical protein